MFVPPYFEFVNSAKLLAGEYALENIPSEMRLLGSSRPMILSDSTLEKIGTVSVLIQALSKGGMKPSAVYTDIPLDSSIEKVNEISAIYRENNADGIIAIGGGSVIDTAKGLKMLISQGGRDIMNYAGSEMLGRGQSVPFTAIPTTSGTGSEATGVAVIKDGERKVKLEFISSFLLPDIAVLDVRALESMPARITALTGLDALTHAIEAYSCLQKNPISQCYALSAIKLIVENLEEAIRKPKDKKARISMAIASYIAGAAFSNSMVGIVHAIGHSVGGVCSVAHGEAMTILLPVCMRYNLGFADDDYADLLLYLSDAETYASTEKTRRAEKAVEVVENFISRIKAAAPIATNLSERGVGRSVFEQIAIRAMNDGALIVNPRSADKDDILKILEKAF